MHPFMNINNAIMPNINKIKQIFNNVKWWKLISVQLMQFHNKFIKLIKGKFAFSQSIKLFFFKKNKLLVSFFLKLIERRPLEITYNNKYHLLI